MPYAQFNYAGEIKIFTKDVKNVCHSGDNEPAVNDLMNKPYIKKQLHSLDKEKIKKELKEYGAWDEIELSDHKNNLMRLLWLAAWDIYENK